jgi:hypothetical protein
MFAQGALRVGATTCGRWLWSRGGESVADIGYVATLHAESGELWLGPGPTVPIAIQDVTCNISLVARPLPYGGLYWYMLCPETRRRARKLYKFGGAAQFCHRTAIRPAPTYHSQRLSGLDRIQSQRWAIRNRLGNQEATVASTLVKPKWMRWRTFEHYVHQDTALLARELILLAPHT